MRIMLLVRGAAVALSSALCADLAAHEGHGVPDSRRPLDGLGASAAFDGQGVLWSVSKGGNHVVLHHSTDAGRSWSWGKAVNTTPEPVDAEGGARPTVAVGAKGELYVGWTQPLAKSSSGHIRFARSLDGGNTFDAPLTVPSNPRDACQRLDAMTVDRNGRVYLAWANGRDGTSARKEGARRGGALYYAVSEDRGQSFRGSFKLAQDACSCAAITLLPRDGGITALWRPLSASSAGDHVMASLHPDGRVDGLRSATYDNGKPIRAAWPPKGAKYAGVRPDVAINGNRVAVAWVEVDGEHSRLRGMRSDDGGATWREATLAVIAGAADAPRILVQGGGFHVFWNTRAAPRSVHVFP